MVDRLETLEEFNKVNVSFPYTEPIKQWKEQGKKVVGWLCNYVPEEIIHAAGILPIRITADSHELELDDANAYLHIYTCSFCRSCLQLALDKQFNFLDGVVVSAMCDGSRRLGDVLNHYSILPLIYSVGVPRKFNDRAEQFYRSELLAFKQSMEQFFNVDISQQALRQSIEVYNKTRLLLGKLYELRKLDSPPISGAETMVILNAGFMMPKEQFNPLLEKLLMEASQGKRALESKVRLMIDGSIINNTELIESIEELGGLVVVDGLCSGIRYWEGVVDTDPTLDPVEALSKYYLNKFPCPRMFPLDKRIDKALQLVRDYRVEGVICQVIRYCNTHIWDLPGLKVNLEDEGIPMLSLDIEYGTGATGQIKTRVQAFIEMLLGKGG